MAALSSMPAIAPIQELLSAEFPELRPSEINQMEITLNLGPATGVQQQQAKQTIWKFSGNEAGYEVIVAPAGTQISVGSRYRDRQQFSDILQRVCIALAQGAGVTRLDSFGVRYVNAAPIEPGWEGWWNPELLGWLTSPELHAQQIFSMSQTSLNGGVVELDNHAQIVTNAVIRHGLVPGVGPDLLENGSMTKAYIVDCELNMAQPITFTPLIIDDIFREYNHEIARFFSFALSDAGRRRFAVEARAQ
jgi:uncharacterized protein (TIGR04255 family)